MLLKLRAQLVWQTHLTPPNHVNPLRFGGSIPPPTPGPPVFPRVHLPLFSLPSSAAQLPQRPTVRLPPAGLLRGPPTEPPTARLPPPHAPRRPQGS